MQYVKPLFAALIFLTLTFTLAACDEDDVTGPNIPSEVPSPPNFSQMGMETDLFTFGKIAGKEVQHPSGLLSSDIWTAFTEKPAISVATVQEEEADPFLMATLLVSMIESAYSVHTIYSDFFTQSAVPGTVEISGNEFSWSFSAQNPELDETVDIKVTATVMEEDVDWSVIASADLEEGGFEEQQIVDGTSTLDGHAGDWSINLNVPEAGFSFASSVTWDFDGDKLEKLDITTSLTEDETEFSQEAAAVYTLDGTEATISNGQIQSPEFEGDEYFEGIDITQPFTISWDTESQTGMISIDNRNFCWDENQEPADC
ncbi:MAG: hypothetical protein R6U28_12040 [Cyclonatronaceae bacterium]